MTRTMETQLLRDQDIFPTEDVLEKVLGKRYVIYKKLIDTVTGEDYGLALEWRFYNDGKAWLGKATHKKKTIFWLSVWEGFFRTNFYFTEKTRGGILELNIDEKLKTDFAETWRFAKLSAKRWLRASCTSWADRK